MKHTGTEELQSWGAIKDVKNKGLFSAMHNNPFTACILSLIFLVSFLVNLLKMWFDSHHSFRSLQENFFWGKANILGYQDLLIPVITVIICTKRADEKVQWGHYHWINDIFPVVNMLEDIHCQSHFFIICMTAIFLFCSIWVNNVILYEIGCILTTCAMVRVSFVNMKNVDPSDIKIAVIVGVWKTKLPSSGKSTTKRTVFRGYITFEQRILTRLHFVKALQASCFLYLRCLMNLYWLFTFPFMSLTDFIVIGFQKAQYACHQRLLFPCECLLRKWLKWTVIQM